MGRRTALLLALAAAALLATSALGVVAQPSVRGNPTRGKALFLKVGIFCGSCHTLKAVKATGRDGPNLDKAKPSYARIVDIVTKGRTATSRWPTGMPGYGGKHPFMNRAQIQDVAAFVYTTTHK